jgi:ABC-2 type transport system ATP-binding protein
VVEAGTLAELRHLTRVEVSFSADDVDARQLATIPAQDVTVAGGRVRFTVGSDEVAATLPELARLRVAGLRVNPPTLEELFLRHYQAEQVATPAGDGQPTREGER